MAGRKGNREDLNCNGHTWYMSIRHKNQSYLFIILQHFVVYFQVVYKYISVNISYFIHRSKTFYSDHSFL